MLDSAAHWLGEYARVVESESATVFSTFTYADAWTLGSQLRTEAARRSLPITMSIVLGEQRVFHAALPGSSALNDDWIERKVRVVARHNMSSYGVGCLYRSRGQDYDEASRYEPGRHAAFGGAVPIRTGELVVGVVAVSGLTELEDHELVMTNLAGHLNSDGAK